MPFCRFLLVFVLLSSNAIAEDVDISNPRSLMFVADATDNFIDVVSLSKDRSIFRIETSVKPSHVVVSPYAPILIYADASARKMVFYDLEQRRERKIIDLPMTPNHMVLDPNAVKIGVTDDQEGGFALVDIYDHSVEFMLEDFPATSAVLFDANEVDVYFSNGVTGSLGILGLYTKETREIPLTKDADQSFTSPSRSLDGRYIYVGNMSTSEMYSVNAFSGNVFKTFEVDGTLARPYTTPEGSFLYIMDKEKGRLLTVDQHQFNTHSDVILGQGIDSVVVGRFDRFNLFLSTENNRWYIYDNVRKSVVEEGMFTGIPISAFGSADGKMAYVAFAEVPMVAKIDLEKGRLEYISATESGGGALAIGLTNNVCH